MLEALKATTTLRKILQWWQQQQQNSGEKKQREAPGICPVFLRDPLATTSPPVRS